MLCVVITVQVYVRMKIQVLPVYSPTPEEVANPDAFAHNVRAAMALANGNTTFELSNFDGLLYADGYGKGMIDVAEYAINRLLPAVETKEAMRISKLHYTKLTGVANAFRHADRSIQGKQASPDVYGRYAPRKLY